MKKVNVVFLGECVVIVALLLLIGNLIQTENRYVWGKEKEEAASVEERIDQEEADSGQVQYAKDLLNEQKKAAVSANETVSLQETVSEKETVSGNESADADGDIKIAVFGDSIWDDKRGEDGISERLEEMLDVEVYNCAVGGTSAAVISDPTDLREGWRSISLNGLMYIARGEENSAILEDKPAREEIDGVDFKEVDYLLISYGLNDFFSRVVIYPEDMYDMTTYVGALRHAVAKMTETYPDMEVIIIGPTYTEHFADPNVDSLEEYAQAARTVAEEYNVHFLDMYHGLGINAENKTQYLDDGVHLTAEGRALYADYVSQKLKEIGNGKVE